MSGARIQIKRSTAASWTSNNPVLYVGEIGYETDTKKIKVGDGTTAWTSLAYSSVPLSLATLNDLGDVTISSAANGDFLRWNGTAWVNDAVDLATDTTGSFVQSLVAGTGITLTNNSGENSTPTIAVTTNTFDAFGAASTAASNAATALSNHEADTTNIHGIADTSILVTTTGTQTLTNKTITSPAGLVKGDVGLGNVDNTADTAKPVSTAQQTALNLKANLASPTFTGTVTVPTPTNATDAATKAYADAIAAGINWHESVELATATALPNSPTYDNGTSGVGSTLTATSNGRLSVDGVNATTGDRILVKDQATATQNGIYVVTAQGSAGATYLLTRATDHDGANDDIVWSKRTPCCRNRQHYFYAVHWHFKHYCWDGNNQNWKHSIHRAICGYRCKRNLHSSNRGSRRQCQHSNNSCYCTKYRWSVFQWFSEYLYRSD